MFGWCGRTGTFVKLPTPNGLVRVLFQIMSRGPTWRQGGPHHPAVLHGIRRTWIEHRLVLQPTVFRLHAGSRVRHGDHSAFPVPVAT